MSTSDLSEQEPINSIPPMAYLCLELPLYTPISLENQYNEALNNIYCYGGQIDAYCMDCGNESIFRAVDTGRRSINDLVDQTLYFSHSFKCVRRSSHIISFSFQIHNGKLLKVGQYPSIADIAKSGLKKYKAVLPDSQFKELNKSIGLAAHGVGIGAFVYLRRIFENLIEDAHKRAMNNANWNEDRYKCSRMAEKIGLIKDELPNFLVENKILYGILSKGIHELTEDECLNIFPLMQTGVELILDEVIARRERDDKIKKASQQLSNLQQNLDAGTT